jgi:hypothetical protein
LALLNLLQVCVFCAESTLNEQTWSLGIIGVTMQSVDLQQRPILVIDWGHNHKGLKLINPHIQHKSKIDPILKISVDYIWILFKLKLCSH